MLLFAIAVALGVVGGWLGGGRLAGLGSLRLPHVWVLYVAAGTQVALGLVPAWARPPLLVGSMAVVGGWTLLVPRRTPHPVGFSLLAVGWGANALVMALNGGMPVSSWALDQIGSGGADVTDGHLYKHVPDTGSATLGWLGDVIPVPPLGAVLSLGDLALLAGIALVVCQGMRGAGSPGLSTSREEPVRT